MLQNEEFSAMFDLIRREFRESRRMLSIPPDLYLGAIQEAKMSIHDKGDLAEDHLQGDFLSVGLS